MKNIRFSFNYEPGRDKSNLIRESLQERLMSTGSTQQVITDFNKLSMMAGPGPITSIKEI